MSRFATEQQLADISYVNMFIFVKCVSVVGFQNSL